MHLHFPAAGRRAGTKLRAAVAALGLYAALAVASTWPLARLAAIRIPLGTESTATVPHASAWALWWASDRLGHGGVGLWDAPIFHPTPGAFALSEPLLLQGLLAVPLTWMGLRPVLVHNLMLLVSLVANGLAGRWLLRVLGARRAVALAGGAMMVLLPHAHHELGVLTLVCVAGPLVAVGATLRMMRRPRWTTGACLGAAVGASYLSCAQYGLFIGLALPLGAVWLLRRRGVRRLAVAGAVSLVVAAALIGPVARVQLDARRAHRMKRSAKLARQHSLAPGELRRAPWAAAVPFPGVETAPRRRRGLFPGTTKVLLLAVGVFALARGRRRRRELAFLIAVALALVGMAMAPRHDALYAALRGAVPGLAQIRSVWRAAGLAQALVVVLAGMGLEQLLRWGTARCRGPIGRERVVLATLCAALLGTVELWPPRQQVRPTPTPERHADLVPWIEAHVPPDQPLAFLPHPETRSVTRYANWAWWMMMMPTLRRPMVGGYSSYFPSRPYRKMVRELRRFPEGCWPTMWREAGVRHVVVRRGWLTRQKPVAAGIWRRVFAGEGGYDVYALDRTAPRIRPCD